MKCKQGEPESVGEVSVKLNNGSDFPADVSIHVCACGCGCRTYAQIANEGWIRFVAPVGVEERPYLMGAAERWAQDQRENASAEFEP